MGRFQGLGRVLATRSVASIRGAALRVCLAFACLVACANVTFAQVTVTAPIEVEDYITAASTTLVTGLAVAIGLWFGYKIVRKLLRWGNRALG